MCRAVVVSEEAAEAVVGGAAVDGGQRAFADHVRHPRRHQRQAADGAVGARRAAQFVGEGDGEGGGGVEEGGGGLALGRHHELCQERGGRLR